MEHFSSVAERGHYAPEKVSFVPGSFLPAPRMSARAPAAPAALCVQALPPQKGSAR